MNNKMTTNYNYQQMNLKEKTNNENKTKQITRTGTESEKCTSHERFSVGSGRGRMVGEDTRNKKHN